MMTRKLELLGCLLLLCTGSPQALELQVAIARSSAHGLHASAPVASSRETLLADFNLALARELCRRLHTRCRFSYPDFAEIIPGIENQRYQLGFGSYLRTPERDARVAFSRPLWRSSSRLLAFSTVATRFAAAAGAELTLETLRDARVTTIIGSQQHAYLQRVAPTQGLQISGRATLRECLDALNAEQADFALLPVLGAYLVLDPTAVPAPAFIGPGIVDHGLGGNVHIALPRDDHGLLEAVNVALDGMSRDGSYPRLWRRYFPFDSS